MARLSIDGKLFCLNFEHFGITLSIMKQAPDTSAKDLIIKESVSPLVNSSILDIGNVRWIRLSIHVLHCIETSQM